MHSVGSLGIKSHLKHTDQGLRKVVKVTAPGSVVREVEFTPKHLHAQEWEDDDKEEEKEEQGGNRANGVEERGH